MCERAMRVLSIELNGPGRTNGGGSNLRAPVLEAFCHHHLNPVRRAGDRVLDRFHFGFENSLCNKARHPSVLIEGKLDRYKYRVMNFRYDQTEDVKQRSLG